MQPFHGFAAILLIALGLWIGAEVIALARRWRA